MKENYKKRDLPKQRNSYKEKQKEDWYAPTYNYWIDKAISLNDKNETRINLNAANGIIDMATYEYVLKPITHEIDGQGLKLPGEFRDIDFITPIKEKNMGEYIELPYKFFVKVNNPDSTILRNKAVREKMIKYLEQVIVNMMNEDGMDTGIDSKSQENIEAAIEQYKKDWFDERAIQGQNILNLIHDVNDFETQRIQAFFYWWATEEFYTYRHIEDDEVIKEVLDPLNCYPVDNGEQFIEDYDAFLIKRYISFENFRHYYRDKLTKKQYDYVEHLSGINDYGNISPTANIVHQMSDRKVDISTVQTKRPEDAIPFCRDNRVEENLVFFRTEVKVYILHYIDEFGEERMKEVPEDYELNALNGDIYVEDDWKDEIYKGVRIGPRHTGIYIKPESEVVQRYDKVGRCKLPVGGKRGLLLGNKLNPIPRRIAPYQAWIRFLNLQQERAIAKYKGNIMLMPKSIIDSEDETSIAKQYYYMLADGTIIYDDQETNVETAAQGFRIVANPGLEQYISTLQELKSIAKADAWDLANMNEERYGNTNAYSTVRNTEQNIFRAKLGSTLMISMFNKALEKDHAADLEFSKVAYIEGGDRSYFGRDGQEEKFNITGEDNLESDYGIFVVNSKIEENKLKQYKDLAFSAAQGGEYGLAAKAIDADSSVKLSKEIDEYMEATREFEREMKDRDQQLAQMQIEAQKENREDEQAARLEEIKLKEEMQTDRELSLKSLEGKDDTAVDDMIKRRKMELEERKQRSDERMKDRELDIKEKETAIKRKQASKAK